MTARVLVIGREGQLARELARARWPDRWSATFAGRSELDLRFPDKAAAAVTASAADLVVNAAAYTNVDQAESEPDIARVVNAAGPGAIATAWQRSAPLVSISTDYIFDGTKAGPYLEDDPVNPIGAYGRSKAEGEALIRAAWAEHLILRTSWVFSPFGTNFVKTMMRLGSERPQLRIVADQVPRAGTTDALLDASNLVQVMEHRQGLSIASLEEIAFQQGWIDKPALLARKLGQTPYADTSGAFPKIRRKPRLASG